jgi:two-component system sensor histidine kinase BaeS
VANFEPAAEAKAIELAAEVADGLPLVAADPDRLAQVLRNLLTNALRHTPKGGQVTVSAAAVGGTVEIAVADNGEGIAPEDLPHVFDRFYRGDRSRSRAEGSAGLALRPSSGQALRAGSGLGLAIVRAIVEAHGGQVNAVSDGLGQGSTFRFTLPVV